MLATTTTYPPPPWGTEEEEAAGGGDGVVPYSSSHIAPVESECIVPAGHNVPDHPAACAELERILRLHLEQD